MFPWLTKPPNFLPIHLLPMKSLLMKRGPFCSHPSRVTWQSTLRISHHFSITSSCFKSLTMVPMKYQVMMRWVGERQRLNTAPLHPQILEERRARKDSSIPLWWKFARSHKTCPHKSIPPSRWWTVNRLLVYWGGYLLPHVLGSSIQKLDVWASLSSP